MANTVESFRIEIRDSVTGLGRLNHLKIILVAALLAVAFGVSGFGHNAENLQSYSYWVLAFVPLMCMYIDFQYYHGLAKIFVLAHFLEHGEFTDEDARMVQHYERFVTRIRQQAAPRLFSFESKAQRGSSVLLSLLCPFIGGALLASSNLDAATGTSWNIHFSALFALPLFGLIGASYANSQYDDYVREMKRARQILPSGHSPAPSGDTPSSSGFSVAVERTDHEASSIVRIRIVADAIRAGIRDSLLDATVDAFHWAAVPAEPAADVNATGAGNLIVRGAPGSLTLYEKDRAVCSISWNQMAGGNIGTRILVDGGKSAWGFGAGLPQATRDDSIVRLANSDTLFHTVPGAFYSSFPFSLVRRSQDCVGVLWNTARVAEAKTQTRAGNITIEMIPLAGGSLPTEMYILRGSCAEVLDQLTRLTGRPTMPAAWALGLHQSRWSYRSEAAVRKLVARFKSHAIPCDAIHFDIHHMDGYRVFTWDTRRFPDPRQLISDLSDAGIRAVAIVDPGIKVESGYSIYDAAVHGNHLLRRRDGHVYEGKVWAGQSVFPDFSAIPVRQWWAELVRQEASIGISGIWNDMNEPVLHINTSDDGINSDIEQNAGPHWAVRNLYANQQAEATYSGLAAATNERPFILSRAATSGIQKHAFIWTGDNTSSWKELRRNLNMVVNLGLCGIPFSGADIGGFANPIELPPAISFLKVVKLRKKPELFCRWIQLGSLLPFFRIHTALFSHAQEPWSFGKAFTPIIRKHILRRYTLLPYIYAQAWNAARCGMPLVRPMFIDFPDLPACPDQFMLGPSLLAAPVMDATVTDCSVLLPRGTWTDFETGQRHVVETPFARVTLPAPIEGYPLLVRGGTILPLAQPKRNSIDTLNGCLILEIYADQHSTILNGECVIDDGVALAASASARMIVHGRLQASGEYEIDVSIKSSDSSPLRPMALRLPGLELWRVWARGREMSGTNVIPSEQHRSVRWTEYLLPEIARNSGTLQIRAIPLRAPDRLRDQSQD